MQVKTDTKEKFHVITVKSQELTADMSAELADLVLPILQNDVRNLILNLKELQHIDESSGEMLVNTQQKFYESNASFVICELQKTVEAFLDEKKLLELLNITPTQSEASDVVLMEEIERELLDGL